MQKTDYLPASQRRVYNAATLKVESWICPVGPELNIKVGEYHVEKHLYCFGGNLDNRSSYDWM
ncbi:MAG: hypothetical protein ABIB93_05165 [Chloroflexota bacterium]